MIALVHLVWIDWLFQGGVGPLYLFNRQILAERCDWDLVLNFECSFANGLFGVARLLGLQALFVDEGLLLRARVPVSSLTFRLGEVGRLVRILIAVHAAIQRGVVSVNARVILNRLNL